jgi:hypothetical protein
VPRRNTVANESSPKGLQKLTSQPYSDELKAMEALQVQSQQPGFEFGLVDPLSPVQFEVVTYYRR